MTYTAHIFGAAAYGNLRIVKKAIDNGFDINQVNSKGKTLLQVAYEKDQFECIRWLLQNGANGGPFLLCNAVYSNDENRLQALLDLGISPNAIISGNGFDYPIDPRYSNEAFHIDKDTALLSAIRFEYDECAITLIEGCCDLDDDAMYLALACWQFNLYHFQHASNEIVKDKFWSSVQDTYSIVCALLGAGCPLEEFQSYGLIQILLERNQERLAAIYVSLYDHSLNIPIQLIDIIEDFALPFYEPV